MLRHVSYRGQIAEGPARRARRSSSPPPEARGRGVGASLAELARRRAERRGCHDLSCTSTVGMPGSSGFLTRQGWRSDGEVFRLVLESAFAPSGE